MNKLSILLWATLLISGPVDARQRRSVAAKHAFQREHPCPATGLTSGKCHGYVIDHIDPLCHGGADAPGNMRWQTIAEGKRKDNWERKLCRAGRSPAALGSRLLVH